MMAVLPSAAFPQARPPQDEGPDLEFDRPAQRPRLEPAEVSPLLAVQRALPAMISWPKENGELAIRTLVMRGPELIPVLREILEHGALLERSAAVRALCLLEDHESLPAMEELLADRRQASRAGALLESIGDLDPARASALARTYLDQSASLRRAGLQYLRSHSDPGVLEEVRELFVSTTQDEVQLDAFRLLVELGDPKLVPLALERVGISYAPLAQAIAEYLSVRCTGNVEERLLAHAPNFQDRVGLHSLLILCIAERRSRRAIVPDALFEPLLSELHTSDPMLRAVACIACATIGYRREDLQEIAQDKVVPALADLVIRGRFFPDFKLCFRAAVAMLERVTGEHLGENIPAWRDYWKRHGGDAFLTIRQLHTIRVDGDAPQSIVRWQVADSLGEWKDELVLLGENYRLQLGREGAPEGMIVSIETMREALVLLQGNGFLSPDLPAELVETPLGSMRLTLEVRGRVRTVVAPPGDPQFQDFARALYDLAVPSYWQRFLVHDDEYSRHYREEEAWWLQHGDPAERTARTIDLALIALEGTTRSHELEVLTLLGRIPDLSDSWTSAQVFRLGRYLAGLRGRDQRGELAFGLLMQAPADEAVEALVRAFNEDSGGLRWIQLALQRSGQATAALEDERALVRLAALGALEKAEQVPAERIAVLAHEDPDSRVRARALIVLGDRGGDTGRDLLVKTARDGTPAERVTALRALGRVEHPDALQALAEAVRSEDVAIAQAAYEGLHDVGTAGAAAALESVILDLGIADNRGFLALAQLRAMPVDVAAPALNRLREKGDPELVREATYGLADLGDLSTTPFLMEELEDLSQHRRAIQKLTFLFCRDLETEPWRYRSLYEADPEATHADHYFDALREAGIPVPSGLRAEDPNAGEFLVRGVLDDRWYVRRAALDLLEQVHHRNLGRLSVSASRTEIEALAALWQEQVDSGR